MAAGRAVRGEGWGRPREQKISKKSPENLCEIFRASSSFMPWQALHLTQRLWLPKGHRCECYSLWGVYPDM